MEVMSRCTVYSSGLARRMSWALRSAASRLPLRYSARADRSAASTSAGACLLSRSRARVHLAMRGEGASVGARGSPPTPVSSRRTTLSTRPGHSATYISRDSGVVLAAWNWAMRARSRKVRPSCALPCFQASRPLRYSRVEGSACAPSSSLRLRAACRLAWLAYISWRNMTWPDASSSSPSWMEASRAPALASSDNSSTARAAVNFSAAEPHSSRNSFW
mmetsp:Transcript_9322/g.23085  ORF Transcript_9322/g.23085 Transcript_9322/m.23085 type:complete len:219 (-) Transcript_9322:1109-1765(-)